MFQDVDRERYEDRRFRAMSEWVRGSNRRGSILVKLAVQAEFGVRGTVYQRRPLAIRATEIAAWQPVVRRMYLDTQSNLGEQGIASVRLFRGVKSAVVLDDILTSWTSNIETARAFGSYRVLVQDAPSARIFMYYDGPGWVTGPFGQQWEYVMLSEATR